MKSEIIRWDILPMGPPALLRHCGKCGGKTTFVSTGKFRVNAQGRRLDVWLIWQCAACRTTWNMALLSRVRPGSLGPALLQPLSG